MPEHSIATLKNFVEADDDDTVVGRLTLGFQATSLNLNDLWENSTLSAKFLSTF